MSQIPQAMSIYDRQAMQWIGRITVRVNDMEQKYVISYNCIDGVVERYETAPDGQFIRRGDEVATETVRGNVTVELST